MASDGIGDRSLVPRAVSVRVDVIEKTCVGGGAMDFGALGALPKNSVGDLNLKAPGMAEEIDGTSSYSRDCPSGMTDRCTWASGLSVE